MRKITLADVLDIAEYERQRKHIRPKIMEIKDKRRIQVGPRITYLFENFDTMLYQVQEMTRAERIVEEQGIMGELNAYNELIPDKNQLSASLLIEIDNMQERLDFLTKIVDLPDHTYLIIQGERIRPSFDPRQGTEDKLSSVQYIKFNLNENQVDAFNQEDSIIKFGFDHSLYSYDYALNKEQKATLYKDLIVD
jgi:hypothetical protein